MACAFLAGCFPYVTTYVHVEAPGATAHGGCAGPATIARVQSGRLRLEVSLEPGRIASRTPTTGFLAVTGAREVSLASTAAHLLPEGRGATKVAFQLRPAGFQRFEFAELRDIPSAGTLHLPALLIDGAEVALPVFRFERRPYAGFLPLNC